jgi:serine/threonine protein kinase
VVAVKRFKVKPRTRAHVREDFLREKNNLVEVSRWNHRHLLGMLATFETKCANFETLNIVLPFAGGGNLYDFLRLEQDSRWQQRGYPTSDPALTGSLADWRYAVFRESAGLVDALRALHESRKDNFIIHRDIKPANILIQKGTFKLADFGLSTFKDSDETSKTDWHRGTALYSPPERDSPTGVGRCRDVWALGCVLLEVVFMIRYAFQPEVVFHRGNIIDDFHDRRLLSSKEIGERECAVYSKTMKCVYEETRKFSTMRPGLRRRINLDGMLPTIRRMMEEDPDKRLNAAEAAIVLHASYQNLATDPQLQREIEFRDNPGRPPVDWDGWNSFGSATQDARQNTGVRRSFGPLPNGSGPHPRPPPLRAATTPAASTGATEQMVDMSIQDTKRPASSDETISHQPPLVPRSAHPFDLERDISQPETFSVNRRPSLIRRPSLMEGESATKRRRTDSPF